MLFFDEMLIKARGQLEEEPLLALTLANAQNITISNEIPVDAKAYEFFEITKFGTAKVISVRSTDVPLIGEDYVSNTVRIYPIRLAFQLEYEEMELADANAINALVRELIMVSNGLDMKLDEMAYTGELGTTLKGLANNNNVTVTELPADGNENGGTNSAEWRHKKPEDILRDLNILAMVVPNQTGNTRFVNRLLLPMSKLNFLATTPFNPSNGENILSVFLANQRNLPFGGITQIIGHPSLENIDGAGRAVAYNSQSPFNKLHIPQGGDFRDLPYSVNGTTIKVPCQMRTAGVEIGKIKELAYASIS